MTSTGQSDTRYTCPECGVRLPKREGDPEWTVEQARCTGPNEVEARRRMHEAMREEAQQ